MKSWYDRQLELFEWTRVPPFDIEGFKILLYDRFKNDPEGFLEVMNSNRMFKECLIEWIMKK